MTLEKKRDELDKRKLNHYIIRTAQHIHRVQNNAVFLATRHRDTLKMTLKEVGDFLYNIFKHDRSKFSNEQFLPYIELTEYYYQRKVLGNVNYEYPPFIKEEVDKAVDCHYLTENHHPERFAIDGIVEDGFYTKLEAIETVCDLQAMAQEFSEGSCRGYYENVWLKEHEKYITDNWIEVKYWMEKSINCFEQEATKKVGIE